MTRTRITLATSALVACVVFIQSAILTLYGYGFDLASVAAFDGATPDVKNTQQILPFLPGILVGDLIVAVGFAAGVFVSLRFIRSIAADLDWRRVVLRGVVATAVGSAAVLAVRLLETLLTAVRIGPYPLGYSFTPSFDSGNVQLGLANALGQLINPFVDYVPLVVLGCVFLKLWLGRIPPITPLLVDAEPAKGRASRVG